MAVNAEKKRLGESHSRERHWKRWGPYLSERAWGTVREDYSPDGSAWDYFPHDHARSRAYRWNEDGLGGICDNHQRICFALSLWNGKDPILKERLFGLTGPEGNHGEDVKEIYYYLDSTPTHSYMKFLYKYPQAEFPYMRLIDEARSRTKEDPEFELIDTGVFEDNRYFDVFVEYAKGDVDDILVMITVANRGPEEASLNVLPTVWLRNRWTWDGIAKTGLMRDISPTVSTTPSAEAASTPPVQEGSRKNVSTSSETLKVIEIREEKLGVRRLYCDGSPELLFTENETNTERLYGSPNATPFVKDAFDRYVVRGEKEAVNPDRTGTKAAANYLLTIPAGEEKTIKLRLSNKKKGSFADFEKTFETRILEANVFYDDVVSGDLSDDACNVQRQAFAGMLWSKQYYHYVVRDWLNGDAAMPKPPDSRLDGRNSHWHHLFNADVISMPDKWEYPWYAAWDLAFHCIPLAMIDPAFAKEQLILMLREWYMHPNGQIPAYEWAFGDVNPPVHAWAALRVYQIDKKNTGKPDRAFLARIFQKLLLNFTWWVNRKDAEGHNVFEGGFLGLDNIGVFDRSQPLPTGGELTQSDGTSWMAMYCLNMLAIALELSIEEPTYQDVASKFWEHFIYIADAMNHRGEDGHSLWDDEDGFYYDVLHIHDLHYSTPIRIRSMVGLIPLFAVATIEADLLESMPGFQRRMQWFVDNRHDLTDKINTARRPGRKERRLMAVVYRDRLERVLKIMLDENEFLSPNGIRALSKFHKDAPYHLHVNGTDHVVDYEPGESTSGLFGGNSNWRGPIWFPCNYLLIESLQKFHHYYGDDFKVECPTGSGQMMNLWQVAEEISRRLSRLFLRDENGRRTFFGDNDKFQTDPHFKDRLLFHEYFHGDDGRGLGASHQTGWTGLVAKLLQQSGE